MLWLAIACFLLALWPALQAWANSRKFAILPPADPTVPALSLLIPARDEEAHIDGILSDALASAGVTLEVIVLDDHSTDQTRQLVQHWQAVDPRVRLESAPELPPGWCGKQHACWQLAQLATHPLLVFVDADVRLEQSALARIASAMAARPQIALASGFPRQITTGFLDRLLIPLIHFVLLGFLPLGRMRRSTHPGYAAGCGQLFIARKELYLRVGGHQAIRATRHDGLKLPALFRKHNCATDIFDATDLATCHMYESEPATWSGLAKNATEGLGSPGRILPMTLILLGGQVLPLILLLLGLYWPLTLPTLALLTAAYLLAYTTRILCHLRYTGSKLGTLLHPLSIILLITIQWYALTRKLLGGQSTWRGRNYAG